MSRHFGSNRDAGRSLLCVMSICHGPKYQDNYSQCATPGCQRSGQYPTGCVLDRCCRRGFITECKEHDDWCDRFEAASRHANWLRMVRSERIGCDSAGEASTNHSDVHIHIHIHLPEHMVTSSPGETKPAHTEHLVACSPGETKHVHIHPPEHEVASSHGDDEQWSKC